MCTTGNRERDKMNTKLAAVVLAVVLGFAPLAARAGSQSTVTLGLGSSVGLSHVLPVTGGMHNSVLNEMNVRLRLLKVLGVDFNYNVSGEQELGHGEVYSSNMRASALLYLVPTKTLSLYVAAGTGASSFSDLTSSEASEKSYHGGGGMEIYVGKHLALTTEFLMLVPEVEKVVITTQPLRLDGASSLQLDGVAPAASDYISIDNYQLSFGLRYFF